MKRKRRKICLQLIACVLMVTILLCSCGMRPQPESDASSSLSTEHRTDSEQSSAGEPTSQSVISETDNTDGKTNDASTTPPPPAPPVCELDFTQTDSFPYPFENELLIDKERGLLLSAGQALYDYDTMWQLLEENYPCFPAIKIELGIDWEKVKADYRQKMEDCAIDGYISQEDFIFTIKSCVKEFRCVGHLFVMDEARSSYIKNFRSMDGMIFQNLADLMDNPKSELFYSHAEQRYFEAVKSGYINREWKPEPIEIEYTTKIATQMMTGYVQGTVPYLQITSFSGWPKNTHDVLAKFFAECAGQSDLIIDVRGNQGGNSREWYELVSVLEQSDLTWGMFWGVKSGTLNLALNPNIKENFGRCYTDDTWQDDFPYIQPEKMRDVDIYLNVVDIIQKNGKQNGFKGKIWVLIDELCYSATDGFARFCKETGFAALVGTATAGNGIGAQPYFMALPYSGLLVEYTPYLSFNQDGTCNGIKGTTPDIASENSFSALEMCLEVITRERKE